MRSRAFRQRHRTALALLAQILVMMTVVVATVYAVYSVQRPLADGKIHQWHLYGEDGHKGVDFPAIEGTDVYAVADGVVMDLKESVDNGTGIYFGNYVLIRHNDRHYVRHNDGQLIGQMGHVYSIYAHLSKNSVPDHLHIGDTVTAGEKIAEVDDTGSSTGNHLHLQIVLDPSPDHDDGEDYDWTETTSRNPEAWLDPFDDGEAQTATVIGKVTDANGNPVPNLRIRGMQKPDDAIWNPAEYPYGYSETYNDDRENPDDIMVENFATTDIAPGNYHLYARYSDGTLYRDLGWHTVEAGQTTYVGLYPIHLPDVKSNYGGWNSFIVIRNDSTSKTAKATTTIFRADREVHSQRTDSLAPRASLTVDPSGTFHGSASVAASEDVSVVVVQVGSGRVSAYTGLCPPGMGDYNWEEIGTDVYLPHVYRKWGYESVLTIFNPGPTDATVSITYIDKLAENEYYWGPVSIPANGTRETTTGEGVGGIDFFGSAHVHSSAQPVAVLADALYWDGTVDFNNTALNGATGVWLPYLMKNYWGWNSCFSVRNLSAQQNVVKVQYYWPTQSEPYVETHTLGGNKMVSLCQGSNPGLPDDWWKKPLSARVWSESNRAIAVAVNQSNSIDGKHMSYSSFAQPSTTVILPHLEKNPDWVSGIHVQNAGDQTVNPSVSYCEANGQCSDPAPMGEILPGHGKGIYLPDVFPSSTFYGSAVITADQPLVAVGNATCGGWCSGDEVYTYNGVNR